MAQDMTTNIVNDESRIVPQARRQLGALAGKFTVPDDFDAPLPEDVLLSFEGTDGD